jgi:uncharacterized protein
MIIILSPSKGQDFTHRIAVSSHTIPKFLNDSRKLIDELRKLDSEGVQSLMSVSKNIADLNVGRYLDFSTPFTPENGKQALFSFTGDVYSKIECGNYTEDVLRYAQQHLRILSGLYGCLRPLDLIQPYRLEMKTKLQNARGKDLYQFWGDRITEHLNHELEKEKTPLLINLASNEYFKVIKAKKLNAGLLTINFKEIKNGKARTIAIFAKQARGMMTDFILNNKIGDPEEIKKFSTAGYSYSKSDSDDKQWTFCRQQPPSK